METEELAELLLPPEIAKTIKDHISERRHMSLSPEGYSDYSFYTEPKAGIGGGCIISAYNTWGMDASAIIGQGKTPSAKVQKTKVALGDECSDISLSDYAHLNPGVSQGEALAVLHWFKDVQLLAKNRTLPTGYVECRSEFRERVCKDGPVDTLALLPLEKVYAVSISRDQKFWEIWIMPTGPGQVFYSARLSRINANPIIDITYKIPAPF